LGVDAQKKVEGTPSFPSTSTFSPLSLVVGPLNPANGGGGAL